MAIQNNDSSLHIARDGRRRRGGGAAEAARHDHDLHLAMDFAMQVYLDSHRDALAARIRRHSLLDLSKELLQIALEGLRRQKMFNALGEDETIYLEPLDKLLALGKCPADLLIEKWQGELDQDIRKLIAYSAYQLP